MMRRLTSFGLYSKGAEKAADLPEGSFPAQQLIGQFINKGGVSKDELLHSGLIDEAGKVHPDWAKRGKITKNDLIEHLHGALPQIEETALGVLVPGSGYPPNLAEIEQAIVDRHRPNLDAVHRIVIDSNRPREERDRAFDEYQRLQDLRDQEIDAAIPNREEIIRDTEDKYIQPKFSGYTLPGGKNYREVLLRLPQKDVTGDQMAMKLFGAPMKEITQPQRAEVINALTTADPRFKSSHWDDPNVLAHIRMLDRIGPNGEKILHVEELQSDWAQKGRKEGFAQAPTKTIPGQVEPDGFGGYKVVWEDGSFSGGYSREAAENRAAQGKTNEKVGVPSAPYVTNTQTWTDLALKRVLKEAAEGGYDHVVWTPGVEQAKRYDLSKQISNLEYVPSDNHLKAFDHSGRQVVNKIGVQPEKVSDYVGKEVAQKLLSEENATKFDGNVGFYRLGGQDLSVGGEGMKGYYDKIVPTRLQKLAREYDPQAKVEPSQIMLPPAAGRNDPNQTIQPLGLQITPQMRESILNGQSAFADGGVVEPEEEGITAYHGSPHDFEQFDISKIGTGEGAQAFGHGLYFAESEPTAKSYAEASGDKYSPERIAKRMMDELGDRETAIQKQKERIAQLERAHSEDFIAPYRGALEILQSGKEPKIGHMYEVHINAHPDHFLDWDAPLSKQGEHIQDLARSIPLPEKNLRTKVVLQKWREGQDKEFGREATGETLHHILSDYGANQTDATNALQSIGVRGIRYLDRGSRSEGEGTRNYVVFNHDHVKVRRKYMRGGAV